METYVYGIVTDSASPTPSPAGAADPGAYLVRYEDIAAVASNADHDKLTRPDSILAHQRLLDAIAAHHPVLPLRFGTVLHSPEAVANDLLKPAHERFRAALASLEGCAQYLVKGRYVQETVLQEVLADNPEARSLRDDVVSVPDANATRHLRIRLGEITAAAIAAKRAADTRLLTDALAPCCVASSVREPGRTDEAVNLALLVKTARQAELESLVSGVASVWEDRAKLRVLGPMAPYDFAQGVAAGGRSWAS